MAYALQNTLNWGSAYIEGSPLAAYPAGEPAVTIATMVRNSFLAPPMSWPWNRAENNAGLTQVNVQDLIIPVTNFGFLEKVSLTDSNGNTHELDNIYNNLPLSMTSTATVDCNRPHSAAVLLSIPGTSVKIRFMPTPDAIYTVNLTYQMAAVPFTANSVTSALVAAGGNTSYIGSFQISLFPTASDAMILGFKANPNNNGTFPVVSCTSTQLTVANPNGVAESISAYAVNADWSPLPAAYSDVYNNLFLGEAFAATDDARSQVYRQRGVAALLAKADGLTELQKNIFMQTWDVNTRESNSVVLKLQQGTSARAV